MAPGYSFNNSTRKLYLDRKPLINACESGQYTNQLRYRWHYTNNMKILRVFYIHM